MPAVAGDAVEQGAGPRADRAAGDPEPAEIGRRPHAARVAGRNRSPASRLHSRTSRASATARAYGAL